MVIVAALLTVPALASAANKCPAELAQAKAMLSKASTVPTKTTASRQETQTSRQLAGAKTQDVQAPRSSTQDVQAPRSSTQDVQAPRSPDEKARLDKARKLISDSEAACKKGDAALSTSKAKEAMGLLK
jgi:hypothetical protein